MKKTFRSAEEREAIVAAISDKMASGMPAAQACQEVGINKSNWYAWRTMAPKKTRAEAAHYKAPKPKKATSNGSFTTLVPETEGRVEIDLVRRTVFVPVAMLKSVLEALK